MEYFEMNNGKKIPSIGIGTWSVPPETISTVIPVALKTGYRFIDCAYFYKNEKEIGESMTATMKELNLTRDDVFVSSKLWNTFHRPETVRPAFMTSLNDLKLDYLDLYLIHWPVGFQNVPMDLFSNPEELLPYDEVPLEDTWREMEKLVDDGLVKAIGISNFNKRQIDLICDHCQIKPANLQVEIHANFPNTKLVDYAQSLGISVTAYAPLGSPGAMPGKVNLLDEPWVVSIAEKYGKNSAQVLLRYLLQRKIISIPKSCTPSRIESNFNIFDFQLSDEEMDTIGKSGRNERQFILPKMRGHSEYPFYDEY